MRPDRVAGASRKSDNRADRRRPKPSASGGKGALVKKRYAHRRSLARCVRSLAELRIGAERAAQLERVKEEIEHQVLLRTEELTKANNSLAGEMKVRLQMEAELRQAQKLESVGRMASGVAHEINTPVQFIGDSVHFLKEATEDLIRIVGSLQRVQRSVLENGPALKDANEAAEL